MTSVPSASARRMPTAVLPVAVAPTSAIVRCDPGSDALEAVLDLGTVDRDRRRPAVRAGTRVVAAGELGEERGGFGGEKTPVRANRRMTGEDRRGAVPVLPDAWRRAI